MKKAMIKKERPQLLDNRDLILIEDATQYLDFELFFSRIKKKNN